jgi:hypothetical protein
VQCSAERAGQCSRKKSPGQREEKESEKEEEEEGEEEEMYGGNNEQHSISASFCFVSRYDEVDPTPRRQRSLPLQLCFLGSKNSLSNHIPVACYQHTEIVVRLSEQPSRHWRAIVGEEDSDHIHLDSSR